MLFKEEFNRKYYNPKIDNAQLADYISSRSETEALRMRADVIARKPWDITTRTTLLVLLPFIIFGLFTSLFLIIMNLLPMSNSKSSISEEKEFIYFLITGFMSISQSSTLLFIMITGFAFLLPGIYNYETKDMSLRSYTESSKAIVFNGAMYEVVDYGNQIFIHKTTSPGLGALALNSFKALFYQFKKEFAYKDLLLQIETDSEVKSAVLNVDIKKLLDEKRFKKVNILLLINYFLTLSMYARVPLMIIITLVFYLS